jgi:undecaprenyl-diphosphatase
MNAWEAVLYGLVQGITEYLPVSSSAHLILIREFLGRDDPGLSFDLFLHFGTLLSTLIYFRKDWWSLGQTLLRTRFKFDLKNGLNAKASPPDPVLPPRKEEEGLVEHLVTAPASTSFLGLEALILGTIPALFVGALFHNWIEENLRGNQVLVVTLTIGGIALWLVDWLRPQVKGMKDLTLKDVLFMGCFQMIALIPGISRAGITITAGRILGIERAATARISFLLSAPITAAAVVYGLRKWPELISEQKIALDVLLLAGFSAFLSGLIAMRLLLKLLRRFGYFGFALYRVALAMAIYRWWIAIS